MQRSHTEEIIDAVLQASRALVAIAARSIAEVDDEVTLPQYRALVVLCSTGPRSMGALAEALDCSPSTATRLCDRLVARDLVARGPSPGSRREVEVAATPAAVRLVAAVTRRRRADLGRIVEAIAPGQRAQLVRSLGAFAAAAGEAPDQDWATGWDL